MCFNVRSVSLSGHAPQISRAACADEIPLARDRHPLFRIDLFPAEIYSVGRLSKVDGTKPAAASTLCSLVAMTVNLVAAPSPLPIPNRPLSAPRTVHAPK